MTNSARWLQWKNVALPPPGQARLDQDIIAQIFLKVRDLYKKEGGEVPRPHPQPHLGLHRSAPPVAHRGGQGDQRQGAGRPHGPGHPAADQGGPAAARVRLAQGRRHHRLRQLDLQRLLDRGRQPDGPPRDGGSRPASASIRTGAGPGRPIAACSTTAPRAIRPASRGTPSGGRSGGTRRPRSGSATTFPTSRRTRHPRTHMGPFIMNPEGVGRIFAPLAVFADGPFPEHYEPIESPVENALHPGQSNNPVVKKFTHAGGQVRRDRRRVQHHLHHLPAHRALPLLDQEQPDQRAAHPRAVRRDAGRAGRVSWGSPAATG